MTRLKAWLEDLGDQFWLRPALTVVVCLLLAHGAVLVDRAHALGQGFAFLYSGGAEGARSLLSAVASSAIGVASTIFSITIAALSLASGQMGPRLLRNFVRDSRNQYALGIFLGTFAYALIVLRTVRTASETPFVPNLAVTGALLLALTCVGTLTWYVHHIATSINVERVVDTVHGDLIDSIARHTRDEADIQPAKDQIVGVSTSVAGSNYLQAIDIDELADWAHEHGVEIALRVRAGDYVPFGAPVAIVSASVDGTVEALQKALTFGNKPAALQDFEFSVRQLNEIAVRALSPGINDPFTAGSVLERFGDALCRLAHRHLPTGAVARDGKIVLTLPVTDYGGLCDAMFHTIRQNATGSAYVLIRILEVLSRVAEVERLTTRLADLRRHGDLVMADAKTGLAGSSGFDDLAQRHAILSDMLDLGSAAVTVAPEGENDPATS